MLMMGRRKQIDPRKSDADAENKIDNLDNKDIVDDEGEIFNFFVVNN